MLFEKFNDVFWDNSGFYEYAFGPALRRRRRARSARPARLSIRARAGCGACPVIAASRSVSDKPPPSWRRYAADPRHRQRRRDPAIEAAAAALRQLRRLGRGPPSRLVRIAHGTAKIVRRARPIRTDGIGIAVMVFDLKFLPGSNHEQL